MSGAGSTGSGTIPIWKNGDVIGGLLLALFAACALWLVQDLPARQGFRFASGTAPRIFGYALGAIGLMIAFNGLRKGHGQAITHPAWRATFCIIGALLIFALSIRSLGLFVTGLLSVTLASMATPDFRWKETLIFAVAITVFCALIFPIALNQPVPLWPTIGGK